MERGRKKNVGDKQKQKWNFFVFRHFQTKWTAILTVFFFLLSLFQPAFIALAKQNDKPFPRRLGGNFCYQHRDLTIPTHGFRLSVTRTYNSQSLFKGLLGYGWGFEFDLKVLRVPEEKTLYLLESDGSLLSFIHDPKEKAYVSREKGWQTITKQPDGSYLRTLQGGRRHYFDSAGRLLKMADLNGNKWVLIYSDNGNLLKITASTGQWLEFFYDAHSNIERITDPLRRTFNYQIDRHGDLVSFSDPLGRTTEYNYDAFHNLTEIRYPDNTVKKITYDTGQDLMVEESGPGSTRKCYKYDPTELSVSIKESREKTIKIIYTPDFKKQTIIDPLGGKTDREFNDDRLIVRIKDPAGHQQSFNYDGHGNLISFTNAFGYRTQFSYDPKLNLPVAIVDTLGRRYGMTYDERGNLTSIINPDNSTQRFTYNSLGQIKEFFNENGHNIQYQYDPWGNLIKVFDDMGDIFQAQYDRAGQLKKQINPDGTWASFQYSVAGQIISYTDSGNRTTRYIYDDMDRLIRITDPKGNINLFTYSTNGKLAAREDSLGHRTRFGRDPAGNLTQLNDANGNITRYRYDDMNRVIEKVDAGNNRFKYEYDQKGLLIAVIDAKGQTIRYSYNPLGQLVNKQYPNGSNVNFLYNSVGKITSVQGLGTSLFYTYDSMDRVISKHDDLIGQTVRYTYDAHGNVIKITGPEDLSIQYAYNGRSNMTAIIDPKGEKTEYIYDNASRRSRVNNSNKTFTQFQYDDLGRLSSIIHKTDSGKLLSSFEYTYDKNDRMVSVKVDSKKSYKFAYDTLNRLITETTLNGDSISYEYDPMGNRIASFGKTPTAYSYDSLNRLVRAGKTKYSYDANGNLIKRNTPNGITQYSYDVDKNLTGIVLPNGKQYFYDYNSFGDRSSRDGPEGKILYLYDREDVLAEFGPGKKLNKMYLNGPGIDDVAGLVVGKEKFSVHTDILGSIVALTDRKQEIVSHYDYSAFGQVKPIKEKITISYLFTGARHDAESGLHYLRTRAYDPIIGRFISPDRIDIRGGTNLYVYVNNSPVNYVDPLGFIEVASLILVIDAINNVLSPYGYQASIGVTGSGQIAYGGGGKAGANLQFFGTNDPRNDLYIFGGTGPGIGAGGGISLTIGIGRRDAVWKGGFSSFDTPIGSVYWSSNTGEYFPTGGWQGFDIPIPGLATPAKVMGVHLPHTGYVPIFGKGTLSSGQPSPVTAPPPSIQPPPVPPVVATPSQPPVDNEACLNKVRGLMAAARKKAGSAQASLNSAASSASTVQTSVSRATEAESIANQKIAVADRVIAMCDALPWPLDSASVQSKAEQAAKEGKRLLPIATSYSSEACGYVQRATSGSNKEALRIWHKKAVFLTDAIDSKAATLAGLVQNAQTEVQTIERMRRAADAAKKEAQKAVASLSSASEPLGTAQSALNSMESKITEVLGQIVTATSDTQSAASLKTGALSALSDCTSSEGLKNEIENIKIPSGSEIEEVRRAITTASTDLAQAKTTISIAKSRIMEKKQRLADCADLDTADSVVESAKAAFAMAKTDLSQVRTEGKAAASCANKLAKFSPDKRHDDLAQAMADLQSFPGGTDRESRIPDGSATSSEDLIKAFSDAPATRQKGERETTPTIGRDPDREDVSDLEKQAREKEARIREEEARKTQAKKKEEEDYDRKWTEIAHTIADLTRQQEEINLEKLKGKQKEGEQLLDAARQRTGGILSDSDFQDRLDRMQSDFDAAKKALDEDIARSRRSSGPVECARDFTYGDHFTFNCNCDNYVFDFSKGRCVPNKTPAGTGPIVRQTPDKSGLSDVTVNMTPTTLTVWDHGTEDLDRVNISLNGLPVRENLTLRNARQNITLYLRPGKNTLEVKALNIGDPEIQKQKRLPPGNAAAVEIQGVVSGKRRQQWILMTGDVGYMQIYYQP